MIAAAALASLEGSGWSSTITRNSIFGHFRYLKSAKSWIVCKLNKAFFHFFHLPSFWHIVFVLEGIFYLEYCIPSITIQTIIKYHINTKYLAKNEKNHEIQQVINSHFFTAQCQNPGFSDLHTIHGLPCMYINFDGALSR